MSGLYQVFMLSLAFFNHCTTHDPGENNVLIAATPSTISQEKPAKKHFEGAFSNGMKGDSIRFDISADGKKLENLTFKGYWRCSGKLESTTVGPDGAFTIINNKVNDHIAEPPNGGSTAWRFDLEATLDANTASGTFRMNINNLGCDTYLLKWTAKKVAAK